MCDDGDELVRRRHGRWRRRRIQRSRAPEPLLGQGLEKAQTHGAKSEAGVCPNAIGLVDCPADEVLAPVLEDWVEGAARNVLAGHLSLLLDEYHRPAQWPGSERYAVHLFESRSPYAVESVADTRSISHRDFDCQL